MNRRNKIIIAISFVVALLFLILGYFNSKKDNQKELDETKNIAMYVPYGEDGMYVMVDQETGAIYTITMPDEVYTKDGKTRKPSELKKGNILEIHGNGIMMNSYPGQYPGVTKVVILDTGKETDADQYTDLINQIYTEPAPDLRPSINLEYRTESAVVSSIATEGSYQWNYTDAEGTLQEDKNDSPHILTWNDLMDISIHDETTTLFISFTSKPKSVKIIRWPVSMRNNSQNDQQGEVTFPDGEAVTTVKQDASYIIEDMKTGYIYQVTGQWDGGTVEYGFYTK